MANVTGTVSASYLEAELMGLSADVLPIRYQASPERRKVHGRSNCLLCSGTAQASLTEEAKAALLLLCEDTECRKVPASSIA